MNAIAVSPRVDQNFVKGSDDMLVHEALARMRMREAEQAAREYRQARRLASARKWQRLAKWAARRAERANVLL
jgi:hypothetical protein